jgi:hypothetical protein
VKAPDRFAQARSKNAPTRIETVSRRLARQKIAAERTTDVEACSRKENLGRDLVACSTKEKTNHQRTENENQE